MGIKHYYNITKKELRTTIENLEKKNKEILTNNSTRVQFREIFTDIFPLRLLNFKILVPGSYNFFR